jgi:hypothetical protein
MSYKGKYTPKNKNKYIGDVNNVIYRSLWERQAFKWLDHNPKVSRWGSEIIVIPYYLETDSRVHRYFSDLYIEFADGTKKVIEIKPSGQTRPPKKPARKTRRFIAESLTYIKNESKWNAARQYCKKKGFIFEIWTEQTLKAMGIKLAK